jgi:hypothetical protein
MSGDDGTLPYVDHGRCTDKGRDKKEKSLPLQILVG